MKHHDLKHTTIEAAELLTGVHREDEHANADMLEAQRRNVAYETVETHLHDLSRVAGPFGPVPGITSHTPQTLVFRPTYVSQVLVHSVKMLNVPFDGEVAATLASGSSGLGFTIVSIASYDVIRIVATGQILETTLSDQSDGTTPLTVTKGQLVELFVQLTVPGLESGNVAGALSVRGSNISGGRGWAFSIPLLIFATNATLDFPAFQIKPGETKTIPVSGFPGALAPPPSITLTYVPQGDTQFSIAPVTLTFPGGQPAIGSVSVTCSASAGAGFHYLRFDVSDAAHDPFDAITVVAQVVLLRLSNWQFVGPRNYGILHTGASPVSGRVNAVAFDPSRRGTWYLGAAMGGVWKTTDFGATWAPLSDQWNVMAVNSIAIDPHAPNTIYVGTGDVPRASYAMGVMKSSDGGVTWVPAGARQLGSQNISRVLVDPSSSSIVWATIFGGQVWRSSDAGTTWAPVTALPSIKWLGIERAVAKPGAADRYYAFGEGVGANLWRTDDGGIHWTQLTTPLNPVPQQRPLMACSPIFPDNVYLFSYTDQRIYASQNAGNTWNNITDNWADWGVTPTPYNFCLACSGSGTAGTSGVQDIIYLGQATVYRSAPGGKQWQQVEGDPPLGHADQHAVAVNPFDPNSVLIANDGGVFNATLIPEFGVSTVFSLNETLGITQVYRADYSPDARFIVAGTQDVGTASSILDLASWRMVGGGDGGACAISPHNPDFQYLQTNFNNSQIQLLRTGDRWQTSNDFVHPLMIGEPRSMFAPMVTDPNRPRVLYVATNFLYRWVEPGEVEGGWDEHLGGQSLASVGYVNAVAIAPDDSDRIYTGSNQTNEVWMSSNAGASWRRIDTGLPRTGGITSISVHPNNPDDVLVALWKPAASVSRLWHCRDTSAGSPIWSDAGLFGRANRLPDFPVNAIVRDPAAADRIWFAGTDIGVFMTNDGGLNWFNATGPFGLPTVLVTDLKVLPQLRRLYAATFGRGIWQATI